jgi:predicted permease
MDDGKRGALVVLAVVGLVLVVACANVSSLLLARYEDRRRELAVRVALGGGRLRLLRQLLVEGLLLALLGGIAALLLTVWALRLLPALLPPIGFAYAPELAVDGRVLRMALGLAFLATFVFALLPAWRATRTDAGVLLKGESAPMRFGGLRRFSGRNLLVVGQLSVALAFLATAALLVRGFFNAYHTELGFDPDHVLIVPFLGIMSGGDGLDAQRLGPEARARYLSRLEAERASYPRRLQEALRALPGVEVVSFGRPPLSISEDGMAVKVLAPGDDPKPKDILCNMVEPDYFRTLGIRRLSGRDFQEQDDRSGPRVVIISEAMAKRFWPGQNPVGQRIRMGFAELVPRKIVGVAGDVPIHAGSGLGGQPEPLVYFPLHQEDRGSIWLLVRTSGNPADMAGLVRREIRKMGKGLVTLELPPMNLLRFSTLPQWIGMWLGGTLGALAFVLAIGGLYGVVAYAVSRRTREVGIRLALGASQGTVLWLLLRDGLVLALAGVVIGLPLTLMAGMAFRAFLFGVSPADPLALGGASALVVSVALLASWLPARRAAKVDPMEALRTE